MSDICMTNIQNHFAVSVIMESRPSNSPWLETSWDAVGICPTGETCDALQKVDKIQVNQNVEQFIYNNMSLNLFVDECEGYYHNLMSPQPSCYIIAREEASDNEGSCPVPFLVSLSFDEAHSYLAGDDLVYSIPIPAELYGWAEAYVIEHYMPEKHVKRKRKDWKKAS